MILVLDNYDSFTYNVVQYLGELGADVDVFRNDEISLDEIDEMQPDKIVISPGPCTPNEAGISLKLVERFCESIPILGICLGHQSIGQAMGGKVIRARDVMHGKTSTICHDGGCLFDAIPKKFTATRYHSLVIERESLPDCFEMSAWTEHENGETDEVMGIRHKQFPLQGVQFHPESIETEFGHRLLGNFLSGAET